MPQYMTKTYKNIPQDFPKLTTLNSFCNSHSGLKQNKSFRDLNIHASKDYLVYTVLQSALQSCETTVVLIHITGCTTF